jgi:hypothetical protein
MLEGVGRRAAGALPKTLLLFCHATGFCKGVWDPGVMWLPGM